MKKLFVLLLTVALMATAIAAQEATTRTEEPTAPAASAETGLALPAGTAVKMKLETPLSTYRNRAGDTFAGRVTEPVVVSGKTMIPVGSSIWGRVLKVDDPRRIRGVGTIDMHPETVTLPNGEKYSINAVIVDTDRPKLLNVNDEGEIKAKGHNRRDVAEVGIGTGVGLGAGALIGGGEGALIGAAVGATATVAHWLTKHHNADIPAGTEIVMEFTRPSRMTTFSSGK